MYSLFLAKTLKNFFKILLQTILILLDRENSIFSGIFTPQGKYLYEFFVIKSDDGYLLESSEELAGELKTFLEKYKLNSDVQINDISNKYVVGVISNEKLEEIKKKRISLLKQLCLDQVLFLKIPDLKNWDLEFYQI